MHVFTISQTPDVCDARVAAAAEHIGATPIAGAYYWYAVETREYVLSSAEQLADLGSRLEAGEADAYSHWCSETEPLVAMHRDADALAGAETWDAGALVLAEAAGLDAS